MKIAEMSVQRGNSHGYPSNIGTAQITVEQNKKRFVVNALVEIALKSFSLVDIVKSEQPVNFLEIENLVEKF